MTDVIAPARSGVRRLLALAGLALAAGTLQAAPAAAQMPELPPEVSSYRLTEANLAKFVRATNNLQALEDEDIDIENPMEGMDGEEFDLDRIVQAMDSHPQVRNALNSAGMNSREYFLFVFAMMQAMFGSIAVEMGGEEALDDMEDGVLKDNIRFVIEHRDALEALGEEHGGGHNH